MSFLLSLVFLSLSAFAGTPLSSYFVTGSPSKQMDQIANEFEIVKRTSDGFEILVPQTKRVKFLSLAPQAQLLLEDTSAPVRAMFSQSRAQHTVGGYHSFSEVVEKLKTISQKHPDLTELVKYGTSKQGHPLLALRVSRHLKNKASTPRVLLTAATHGDEIITTEVLLNLMDQLIEGASSPRFAKILDRLEVVFIPVVNADGFSNQERYDDNADPNRSFPYPDGPIARPTPSIAAEMKFIEKYPMVASIDFHAYSALVMYPWGYTRQPLEPHAREKFESISEQMAATNLYGYGQISTILYIARGSSSDYYFWKYNALALAIELGDSKAPYPSEIPKYIEEQEESPWLFLEKTANSTSSKKDPKLAHRL